MIPCASCGEPTRITLMVDGSALAVLWRCKRCHLVGRPSVLCSPGCYFEHVAGHEPTLGHWEAEAQQEIGGGR